MLLFYFDCWLSWWVEGGDIDIQFIYCLNDLTPFMPNNNGQYDNDHRRSKRSKWLSHGSANSGLYYGKKINIYGIYKRNILLSKYHYISNDDQHNVCKRSVSWSSKITHSQLFTDSNRVWQVNQISNAWANVMLLAIHSRDNWCQAITRVELEMLKAVEESSELS